MSQTNVLMQEWTGPYGGVPPWDRVNAADFPDALERSIAEERESVEQIASNPAPPTFENTIEALERTGRMRDRVQRVFNVMRLVTGSTTVSWMSFTGSLAQVGDAIFRLPLRYTTPVSVSFIVLAALVVISLSVLERRVRGVEVVA